MPSLDYALKQAPPDLFQKQRWNVLTQLIVHANARGRCWPTVERLGVITGNTQPTITAAVAWLIQHGAIELVAYDYRLEEEAHLPPRQHVYQLTGIYKFNNKTYPYLHIAPESGDLVGADESKKIMLSKAKKTDPKKNMPKVFPEDNTSKSTITRPRVELDRIFESLMSLFGVAPDDTKQRAAKKGLVVKFRAKLLEVAPGITADEVAAFVADLTASLPHASKLKDVAKFTSYYGDYLAKLATRAPRPATPAERKNGDEWFDGRGTRWRNRGGAIEYFSPVTLEWTQG